jgi:hypothetical protein
MTNLLPLSTQLVEAFSLAGAIALVLYTALFVVAVAGLAVEAWRALRQWRRRRAVARELDAVHRTAYREHWGPHVK